MLASPGSLVADLDLDALVGLCDRTLEAAHKDLRGGYGLDY
ncbi:hypothetical protein [Mycobacterium colombiense]|nr:hypothetical protein [Mycobacterium colombiense]